MENNNRQIVVKNIIPLVIELVFFESVLLCCNVSGRTNLVSMGDSEGDSSVSEPRVLLLPLDHFSCKTMKINIRV